jgi:hypothetical protein
MADRYEAEALELTRAESELQRQAPGQMDDDERRSERWPSIFLA